MAFVWEVKIIPTEFLSSQCFLKFSELHWWILKSMKRPQFFWITWKKLLHNRILCEQHRTMMKKSRSKSPSPSRLSPSSNIHCKPERKVEQVVKAECNVEHGVAEINSQLCSAMLTMVLNEEVAREFQNRSQAYLKQSILVRLSFRLEMRLANIFGRKLSTFAFKLNF